MALRRHGVNAWRCGAHDDADGLPIGVQLVRAVGEDELLLDLVAQLESAAGWNLGRVADVLMP